MAQMNEALIAVTSQANEIFAKLGVAVDEEIQKGSTELDVAQIARRAGLQLEEKVIDELQIDRKIIVLPWLHWHAWFPWRPLWCWWWHTYHPWYKCCPYWWVRCHWYLDR